MGLDWFKQFLQAKLTYAMRHFIHGNHVHNVAPLF
jgi:hypothetical protein